MADTAETTVALRIIIPYAPPRAFRKFHDSMRRWSIIVAHRRAGAAVNKRIRTAADCTLPDLRNDNVASYLAQAKEIACLRRSSEPLWVEPPNETNGGSSR
jgi:hypothetical protein